MCVIVIVWLFVVICFSRPRPSLHAVRNNLSLTSCPGFEVARERPRTCRRTPRLNLRERVDLAPVTNSNIGLSSLLPNAPEGSQKAPGAPMLSGPSLSNAPPDSLGEGSQRCAPPEGCSHRAFDVIR